MKRVLLTILLTIAAVRPIAAQESGELHPDVRTTKTPLIEAPKPKQTHAARNVFLANVVMFGSAAVEANAVAFGSAQCYAEALKTFDPNGQNHLRYFGHGASGGQFHPYKHAFKITIPLDVGVAALSYVLHKKHHDTASIALPTSATTGQITSAGLKYGVGCF